MGLLWLKALTLRGGHANVLGHVDRVLAMLSAGVLDPSPLVTHHMTLEDAPEAYSVYDRHEALKIGQRTREPIHLLVTDVVMPEMGGRELVDQFLVHHPETRVLYVSGYTEDVVLRHGVLHDNVAFMHKPFSPSALAQKVREVLDEDVA